MNNIPLVSAQIHDAWQALKDFAALHAGSTPELTSVILLTALAFPVLLMSYTRYARPPSPYSRSPDDPSSPKVSDADFSYITSEEVRRGDYDGPHDTSRNTDVLTLVERGKRYSVHFPTHSIDREELSIGALRQQALKKLPHKSGSLKRVKLFFKGKDLTDDRRSCRSEGVRQGSEVLCSLVDASDDSLSDNSSDFQPRSPTKRKRKAAKGKKRKPGKTSSAHSPESPGPRDTLSAGPLPSTDASRTPSPNPTARPTAPQTPAGILDALRQSLDRLVRECQDFKTKPPPTAAKREFEHKRLGEMILTQVLLKLDAVETDEPELRARRKELVRQAQDELKRLDDHMA